MEQIRPTVEKQEILCAETAAPANAMIVFGASGDLTHRKLLPSIFQISKRGLLSENFYLLGLGRKKLTAEQFREGAAEAIKSAEATDKEIKEFTKKLYYISGDYSDDSFYEQIKTKLDELNIVHKVDGCHIFYLSVPPFLYGTIIEKLGTLGLSCNRQADPQCLVRIVVEKPFGRDLQSAAELNHIIHKWFDESQVYRIDHYLGKETVQNILMFRFANSIFEPVWNRNYIDSIQITIAEAVGVEHRAGYYDKSGALRDMFQNHMLQMLSLVAMEPPASFEADSIRDEKVKLLRSIRPFDIDKTNEFVVRGQYGPGMVEGKKTVGYKSEQGVDPKSHTETYVAAKAFIDNLRWKDVPFYLRTGKRLSHKDTEIVITFKNVPHSMFVSVGVDDISPNTLILQIQPQEGINLSFQAKRPGSKICMGTLNMNFSYESIFGVEMPEAYERLLLDCMVGDQTLFTRQDDVEAGWRLLMPVLEAWEKDRLAPYQYAAGSESFPEADKLIESDGRKWRKLVE
jgi:glucose-6-phosphate 1-dehydrogenase